MPIVGRLDQYASMLAGEFDEITANNPSITGLGTYYASEFSENVGITTALTANVFAPYDPVYDEFAGVLYGPGQGTFMRQNTDKSVIVYNEIDEITDLFGRGIVRDGLVLDLDAGISASYSGSGTTWTDLGVYGNDGTLTNGPTYSSANGGSIVFDGTNDFVLFSNTNGFGTVNLSPTASLEIWANVTRKGGGSFAYHQLAGFRNNSNFDFYFLVLDDSGATVLTESRVRTSTAVSEIYVNFPISYFNNWTHIVVTANVNRTDLYLNGVLVGSDTSLTGSFPATSGNFNVGKNPASAAGGGQSWQTKGNISSVRFYNRPLTAAEVLQNYNALKGRYGL